MVHSLDGVVGVCWVCWSGGGGGGLLGNWLGLVSLHSPSAGVGSSWSLCLHVLIGVELDPVDGC